MNTQLNKALTAALKKEAASDMSRAAFWSTYIAPLQNAHGMIDWKAGQAKAVKADIHATVAAWYASEARVIDGVTYDKAALKVALSKTGTTHAARNGAMSSIRVKVWRWTDALHAAELKRIERESGATSSKAPSGKVASGKAATLSQKRSAAAKGKGKAAKAAPVAPASVPMLSEALRDAIAKLKPQSRIAAADQVIAYMRNIVSEARAAMDTAPRKAAKPAKVAKPAAPAPVAIQ